ncbi:hypothetical protein [Embleya sp. NPDC005971]
MVDSETRHPTLATPADPVHLMRLFGIRAGTAVKYVRAARLDKALPRVR